MARKILAAVDLNHDDLISLPEFMAAFSNTPFTAISDQLDVTGMISAAFVFHLYIAMGVLEEDMLGSQAVLPELFVGRTPSKISSNSKLKTNVPFSFGRAERIEYENIK